MLEFLHNFLEYLQELVKFVNNIVRFWQKIHENAVSEHFLLFPDKILFKNVIKIEFFAKILEKSSGTLSFCQKKQLEFFRGLSFFGLEFFGDREKKSLA